MRIDKRITHRVARLATDLIVLLLVLNISMGFVDFVGHPIVAMVFVWASTCGALRQLLTLRAGRPQPRVASGRQYGWVFVGIVWWVAATLAASHQLSAWHVPAMPFAVQVVGAVCLLIAMATPFLGIPHLSRGAFDAYPHAIGSVLLTGSPMIALLVGSWMVVTAGETWRAFHVNRRAAVGAPAPVVYARAA